MKIHRFVAKIDTENKITDSAVVHQIKRVLKLAPGETVIVSDGVGNDEKGIIEKIDEKSIVLKNREHIDPVILPKLVVLYCAILKKENFELVCQKATELGVHSIVPILTERTIKQGLRTERLEKIIKEAGEQSGRSQIPTLMPTMNFENAILESTSTLETTLLFDQTGIETNNKGTSIGIFIGPEGGFTKNEIVFAQEQGAQIVSLGITTLRGETAAIVGIFWAIK